MVREGKEISKIVQKAYDKALSMEDKAKSLSYLDKTFNGLEKAGYDMSEEKEVYFGVVMEKILEEGIYISENEYPGKGIKLIGDSFKRIKNEGYDITEYEWIYFDMFEDYLGVNLS
ncbi:MAG TPA: hypothetical protein VJ912_04235 [Candidatus Nanoarchaeia archaeon]|nr:hypothetical protein [Candidatus Nanoarchaeia archaeon]